MVDEEGVESGIAPVDRAGATGFDDGDVGDADEAEDQLEIGALGVIAFGGAAGTVVAAAGYEDGGLLVGNEAFVTLWADGEGDTDANDVIDPGLEVGGDGEVVHGGTDDNVVGGEQLGDEFVRDGEGFFLLGGVLGGVGVSAGDPGEIDEGEVGLLQVAGDDGAVVGLLPLGDEGVGELARDGVVAAGADVDLEKCRHESP